LKDLEESNAKRRHLAAIYANELESLPITVPFIVPQALPNYHVYVIKIPERRDELRDYLKLGGIQTDIFYPFPHHLQPIYESLGYSQGDFPAAEAISKQVLALPIYAELSEKTVRFICRAINKFFEE